ncbi:hypothetical protein [Georgenia thermotolerans]|uniref:hypothetical protein n=1 Tax=Georgenia thermotolerans TaxID=527326 RepID=UPI0012650141|nr:hypothetical protein [Georgenia thermotolerans]
MSEYFETSADRRYNALLDEYAATLRTVENLTVERNQLHRDNYLLGLRVQQLEARLNRLKEGAA